MNGRLISLGLLLVCVAADPANSRVPRKPSCFGSNKMCPMIYNPVCGSDGQTYGNECALCVRSEEIKMDILITKNGEC